MSRLSPLSTDERSNKKPTWNRNLINTKRNERRRRGKEDEGRTREKESSNGGQEWGQVEIPIHEDGL